MRKKLFILFILGYCLQLCHAVNAKDLPAPVGHVIGANGTYKLSRVKEQDGNICTCLKLMELERQGDKKNTNIAFYTCAGKNEQGFPVKPNTMYNFSMKLKGNQPKTIVNAYEIQVEAKEFWKSQKSKLKPEFTNPVKIENDKWNVVKGSFTTTDKAQKASICVQFWWDEKYGPTMYKIGDFMLIDNVVIEEAPDPLAAVSSSEQLQSADMTAEKIAQIIPGESTPAIDGRLNDDCWKSPTLQSGFSTLGKKLPAGTASQFKIFRNGENLYLGIECFEPQTGNLENPMSENGRGVWKDDVVEIFFAPATESSFLQFVVSSGGGRYTGDGTKELDARYDEWEAKVFKGSNYWSIECRIPWTIIWTELPQDNIDYRLNVCRQRKQSNELSCWSPMSRGFHAANEYGRLFFGDAAKWQEKQLAELRPEIASLSGSEREEAEKLLQKLDTNNLSIFYNQSQALREKVRFLKLGNRKFVVTEVARHRGPRMPFLPEQLASPPRKITMEAAINENASIPLAITNLTDRLAEYQVLLCAEKINRAAEMQGLKNGNHIFPPEKIKFLRAIRVKETDEADTHVRFDPLVEMDKSKTLAAAAKDSALFFLKFDCSDMAPGIYEGFLHVIPLSEPTLTPGDPFKLPQIQSMPFSLNILPIELSKKLRTPFWFFGHVKDKDLMHRMLDEGITCFPVTNWGASPVFDDQGNITEKNIEKIVSNIIQQRKWAEEYRPGLQIRHVVIFSMYHIFMQRFGKDRFEVGTMAWANGFKNWVKLIDEARREAGVPSKDFIVEIEDEPAHSNLAAPLSVILTASKMAKEAAPELQTMLTYSSALEAKDLYQFLPYIDVWDFWDGLLNKNGYAELLTELRRQKKDIWTYRCSTGIACDLYGYYRLHPWRGEKFKVDLVSLWTAYSSPSGFPAAWRNANSAGLYYLLYGESFSSVRNESLLTGLNDLKYYDKLEEAVKQAKTEGKSVNLISRGEKLLNDTPDNLIKNTSDFRKADQFRKEAVELFLELQK